METTEEESSYQYYTVQNEEEENSIDVQDILNLAAVPDDNPGEQIYYLSFDTNTDDDGAPDPVTENVLEGTNSIDYANINLITLEDGRMFLSTDEDSNALEAIATPPLEHDVAAPVEDVVQVEEPPSDDAEEESYQLVGLADGSQVVMKIVQYKKGAPAKPKKFKCSFEGCDKEYQTTYHLSVHMRSHFNSKPYKCKTPGCEKAFATNYSLGAHTRTHTGEKPYACHICSKKFKTSGDLLKHIRIHTGVKPFMCPIDGCGRSFTTSNIRKVHIRSHTGERPYSCDYPNCGKAFTSSTNYKNHLRIHSGEKPYLCSVEGCGKRFTEYSSLYKHHAVHQPYRPFSCFCGHKFKQESALNYHKRLKHNIVVTKDGTEIIVKIE